MGKGGRRHGKCLEGNLGEGMMKLWSRIHSMLRNLFRKKQVEIQLDEEVRACVTMMADERIAGGMSASEAHRTAMADFGGIEQVKQAVRERRAGSSAERIWYDVRYGVRQFSRNPGFTITVIVTLALSIGVNTAIFSIVNVLMLKSLPYARPERMGTIFTRITGPIASYERHHVNGEQFELLRDNVPSLVAAVSFPRASGMNLEADSQIRYLRAGRISARYLDVLGIHPFFGRNFSEAEDRPNGPQAAILSYGLWRSTFSANAKILGAKILLRGEPYTVIGVLAEDAIIPLNADLYTPLQPSHEGEGAGTNFEAIIRLRDGATWQQADAEINHAWALRANRYELANNPGATVSFRTVPLQEGQTAKVRPQVLTLMLAAGFILLIACANLAGLTLVRMLRRTPEFATRLALGASRWQIEKQLWIENLLLALAGGAAGVAVGFVALRGLLLLLPEHFLPVASVPLDGRVLAFTVFLSLLTSVLFGMLPALTTRTFDLRSAIGSRTTTGGEHLRLRQALIVSETALTVVLLAASGLLIRTLIHLQTLPAGFNPVGVMTAKASLDDVRYHDTSAFQKLLNESTAAMRQIPGVQQAAVGLSLPYERTLINGLTISDGKQAGQAVMVDELYTSPGYFAALQIPILMGRSFSDADGPDTQQVAMINRTFARKYFHGASPVGFHLNKDILIVGVVEDVAVPPGIDPAAPLSDEETMYVPATQMDAQHLSLVHVWFQPSWIVRTAGKVEGLPAQMERAMASVDPNLPFSGFYSMRDLLAKTLAIQRVEVALLGVMAALALLLSGVGIFSLVANTVAQKTREIGIRVALGSTMRQAMVHVGAPGLRASTLGLIVGLVLCTGALRAMQSVLFGVGVYDLRTIVTVVLILLAVTFVAAIVPTLRLAAIDPAETLRAE
jgi:predicted permease